MLYQPRIHPAPIIPISRSLDAVLAEVRHSAGRGVHTVPALCRVLRERIGNPDLEDVILAIERIYDAEPQEHWEASAALAKAANNICDDHLIS